MKKANRELTDTFIQTILEVLQVSIDFSDTRVLSGICFGCYTVLWKASKGEKVNFPCLFNFKDIKPTKITRESNYCVCLIYETARVKRWSKSPVFSSESKKRNFQDQHVQKSCSKCFSIIGR